MSVLWSTVSEGFFSERTGSVFPFTGYNVTNLFCVLTNTVVWSLCRFSVALEQFLDSLQMVKNKITPGKLTWPLTKEIVKETQPEYFKVHCLFLLF